MSVNPYFTIVEGLKVIDAGYEEESRNCSCEVAGKPKFCPECGKEFQKSETFWHLEFEEDGEGNHVFTDELGQSWKLILNPMEEEDCFLVGVQHLSQTLQHNEIVVLPRESVYLGNLEAHMVVLGLEVVSKGMFLLTEWC